MKWSACGAAWNQGALVSIRRLRSPARIETAAAHSAGVRGGKSTGIALLVAGEFASSDLERSLEPLLSKRHGIVRIGYLPDSDFWLYASAVDACINLRYPPAGETSGIAIRLMGIGKPVVVSTALKYRNFQTQPASWIPGRVKKRCSGGNVLACDNAFRRPGDRRARQRVRPHISFD